jgi:PAS domain S-box-containing protein
MLAGSFLKGYIIADINNFNDWYASASFYRSLKFVNSSDEEKELLNRQVVKHFKETCATLKQEMVEINISHLYINANGKNKVFPGLATIIQEKDKKFILIKYLKKTFYTKSNIKKIYEKTNEIAKIGGWEVDLIQNKVSWTEMTKIIHEVEKDFEPCLETGIDFYEEGWSRDLITEIVTRSIEKGEPFDRELVIVTAKGNKKWIRTMGTPVLKKGKCISIYGAFQDISERKKREEEYNTVRQRFEIVFRSSPIGIVLVDKNNNILMANPASIKIFGFEHLNSEEVSTLTYKDLIHKDDLEEASLKRNQLLKGEIKQYELNSRFYKSTGEMIWCRTNSTITDVGNDDFLITTQVEDITESKRLEEEALLSAQRFKSSFEHSPIGMALVGLDGNWLRVNDNLCTMFGYTKEEFLDLTFQQVTYKDDLELDLKLLNETLRGIRDSYSIEKRYVSKNGEIIYGLLNVSLIRDQKGNALYFISQINNISERIRTMKELKDSLSEVQILLESTTRVSIVNTDINGKIKKINRGAENLLGYKADQVIDLDYLKLIHDRDEVLQRGEILSQKYGKTIEGFEALIYRSKLGEFDSDEWTYKRKNGEKFPVQLVITSVRNSMDEIVGYLGIATDISQLKEMETLLLEEKKRAEDANRSKSQFLANMSHEIRTPLNGVIGFSELLLKTPLDKVQRNYMEMVNTSANSLLYVINDVLDLSKIEAGKLELYEEKSDLINLCSQSIDVVKHAADSKNIEVLLNISPDVKRFAYADSVRLRQVIINLLGNAIKFTHQGEVELKVENTEIPGTEERLFTFSVRDTGIGIAPQNIQKIFNAFDQEDASTTRKYGGSGLGITISNRILEMMNSKLEVESEVGKGSIFSFTIKLKSDPDDFFKGKKLYGIKKVLIVDDNRTNLEIMSNLFSFCKINTVVASNGIDALQILEGETDFDLLISDYHMPYLSGLDLIAHIRKNLDLNSSKLPAILMHSSIADEKLIDACREADIQYNIVKPIRFDILIKHLENIWNSSKDEDLKSIDNFESLQKYFSILIAEDNPVNQFLAKTIIQKLLPNSSVEVAENGQEAVKLFTSGTFDLVFMDIQMPIMSGFDATKEIRLLESGNEHVPIIALTARALKGEREKCIQMGMDDYITKPIDFELIKKTVENFLAK